MKSLILGSVIVLAIVSVGYCNDNCPATVIWAYDPITGYGSTVGAANNFVPNAPCWSPNSPDHIYSFTPIISGNYTVDLCSSNFDTYLFINTGGACPGDQTIACNDDFCDTRSSITTYLNEGQTYYIVVEGYLSQTGIYFLSITDDCGELYQEGQVNECTEDWNYWHAYTDCNGGCNNPAYGGEELYGTVTPGQTIWGRAFTYIGPQGFELYDTDWYQFSLTEPCTVKVTMQAAFPSFVAIGVDNHECTGWIEMSLTTDVLCSTYVSQTNECLPIGDYVLYVRPETWTGLRYPRDYLVTLETLPCYLPYECDERASFSQPPPLPWEWYNAYDSDTNGIRRYWESFSVTEPTERVTFWGVTASYAGFIQCATNPLDFEIQFVDSSNGVTVYTYPLEAWSVNEELTYGNGFRLRKFEALISPPCPVLNGYVSVYGQSSPCDFFWINSNVGDGSSVLRFNNMYLPAVYDLAFCLEPVCPSPDSLTVRWMTSTLYMLQFWNPELGYARVYASSDPNAVFPSTYNVIAQSGLPQGPIGFAVSQPQDNRIFVVTLECSASSSLMSDIDPRFVLLR